MVIGPPGSSVPGSPSGWNPGGGRLPQACSVGVGLFFGLMFALRSGYSYGAGLLLLLSVYAACSSACRQCYPAGRLSREDKAIVASLLGYFLIALASTAWLDNDFKDIDQPMRAALAIPILLMMRRVPFDLRWMWGGVALGVTLSVGVGWWQLHVLNMPRAEGYLNIIHFGNIALVFGAFCAAGLHWAGGLPRRRRLAWWGVFAVGIGSSAYSILASGSRGSWVALPVLLLLYAIAFLNRRNLMLALAAGGAVVVVAIVSFNQPDSRLRVRYDAAVEDIQLFQQGEADTSLGARFVMWKGAVLNIAERPIAGWNLQAYDRRIAERVQEGQLNPVALKFTDNLHNSYLHVWAFQGLPGLLALLAVYFVPMAAFCRRLRERDITLRVLAYCGAGLCASYALFSLTQVILRRNNGVMFYVIALVILWGALRWREQQRAGTPGTATSGN